jgi:DNA-binding NarL/FixJ family response regulator
MSAPPAGEHEIRVLVVDDHPIVREGLVAVLADQPDFTVIGAAGATAEALEVAARTQPDVALLDLELGDEDGVGLLPQLAQVSPNTRTIAFTAYDTDERVLGAIRAGAKGYLLKGAPVEEIAEAVRTVYAGGSALAPRAAAKLVAAVSAPAGGHLTERERQVLRLVAQGQANKQIAQALSITERTVKFHLSSLFLKLGADNRAQLAAFAVQRHLL